MVKSSSVLYVCWKIKRNEENKLNEKYCHQWSEKHHFKPKILSPHACNIQTVCLISILFMLSLLCCLPVVVVVGIAMAHCLIFALFYLSSCLSLSFSMLEDHSAAITRQHCRLSIWSYFVSVLQILRLLWRPPQSGCRIFAEPQFSENWLLFTFLFVWWIIPPTYMSINFWIFFLNPIY